MFDAGAVCVAVSGPMGLQTHGSEGLVTILVALFNNLPITLLVEGGIFLTLAVGIRLGRRVIKSD